MDQWVPDGTCIEPKSTVDFGWFVAFESIRIIVGNCNFVGILHLPFWLQLFWHVWGHLISTFEKKNFLCPDLKVSRGYLVIGSSVRLSIRMSVCPSVCVSVFPSRLQSAIFKVWVMIQQPNLECKFIYGFRTLQWHLMPLGMGRDQNVGQFFCHILTLLPPGASVFHKHMSSWLRITDEGSVPDKRISYGPYC